MLLVQVRYNEPVVTRLLTPVTPSLSSPPCISRRPVMSPASPKHSNFHSNFGQPSPWESARRMCLLFPCLRLPRLLPRDFLRFVRLAFYAFNICHIFLLYVFPAAPSLLSHFASFALPVFHFSFPAIIISYFLVIPSFAGR